MINTSSTGIPITKDQLMQITAVENRLNSLVEEVRKKQEQSASVDRDIDKSTKEHNYREQALSETQQRLLDAESRLKRHIHETELLEARHKELTQVHQSTSDRLDATRDALVKREDALIEAETSHAKRVGEYNEQFKKLSEDKLLVEKVHQAFLKAAELL